MSGYNSITETMKARILTLAQPLSTYGNAGATVNLAIGGFEQNVALEGVSRTSSGRANFAGGDIPAIKSFSIVSPLGDGLASQPSTFPAMTFTLKWVSVNAGGAVVGSPMASIQLYSQLFNAVEETGLYSLFNTAEAMTVLAANQLLGGVNTQLQLAFPGDWAFAAYSMGTGWDAAILDIWINMVVDHTFTLE